MTLGEKAILELLNGASATGKERVAPLSLSFHTHRDRKQQTLHNFPLATGRQDLPMERSQGSLFEFALGHLVKAPVRPPIVSLGLILPWQLPFIQTDAFINLPAEQEATFCFFFSSVPVLYSSSFFLANH